MPRPAGRSVYRSPGSPPERAAGEGARSLPLWSAGSGLSARCAGPRMTTRVAHGSLPVKTREGVQTTLRTLPPGDTRLATHRPPGQELRLSYRSDIDGTDQPYALYVPTGYDGSRSWPLVINLHGTSAGVSPDFVGQTSEHYTADENAAPLWAAEQHGALLVTPFGRGITEFRGIGENDVFCVVAEVQQRYRVDQERISVTGLSMGGTGSSELALHYPDYFAAAAPIGAAYSFPWLAANGQHLPFWCIGGEHDRSFQSGGGWSRTAWSASTSLHA
ncbi:MAG: hypothetical protein CL878_08210 [Dehalococcoidia bacterium]|nr:hypothetical protein [Dehalococcoidia bacterium]